MTEEQYEAKIIEEGTYFKTIFEDETFIKLVDDIVRRNYEKWQKEVNPAEQTKIWNQNRALEELLTEMKVKVLQMEQLFQQKNQ